MSKEASAVIDDGEPEALVARIADGDVEAESALVRRFSRPMMAMLTHRTGDVQRAEDVHQDTFVIVLERLRTRSIDDPSRIAAFIHKTAINVLIGEYRKEERRQTYPDTDLIQRHTDTSDDQLRQLIQRESGDAVRQAVLEITNTRDRELLYRFYLLQQEKPTVCKVLDMTSEHFDRVISRARKRFRELIEKRRLVPVISEDVAH